MGVAEFVTMKLREMRLPGLAQSLEDDAAPVSDVALPAVVDQGRWIAHCPSCPGAAFVDTEDLRFFCLGCCNEGHEGRWLQVAMPVEWQAIEAALGLRPERWRSWTPDKTVEDLLTENTLHEGW
jgi:hypothetical protein